MICASIGERTVAGCVEALKGLAFAEIRLDMLEPAELTEANVRRIFSQKAALIATCRPGKLSENERKELLGYAIEGGAAFVDIEVEAGDNYKKELVGRARKSGRGEGKGCKVIFSYHDYKRTPPTEELRQIIGWCFESGADIAKIACMVNSERDNARLLGLLDSDSGRKLVVVGMGPKGRLTRVVAPLLGSQFTYASAAGGKETAEGQIEREELEKIMEALRGPG